MVFSRLKTISSTPGLKLFGGADSSRSAPGELSGDLTLRQFFDAWMLPIVLEQQRETAAGTRLLYQDALSWWEAASGNPPLRDVDEWVWSKFCSGLRRAEFRRGPSSANRPMAAATQTKHQRTIRAILSKAEKKGLVAPFELVIRQVSQEVKPDFSLEQARQMAAWLKGAGENRTDLGMPARWWLAFVAMGFYTGLRSGEMRAVTWRMIEERPCGEGRTAPWLIVPGEAIAKTGKRVQKAVHPCLLEAIQAIADGKPALCAAILVWTHDYRHLLTCHAKMQRAAGIPEENILSPHAWRRTFATQLALTGLAQSQSLAQAGLSHSSAETTRGHYLAQIVEATAIRMLPRLW